MNVESIFFCKRIPEKESAARKERMLMSHALFFPKQKSYEICSTAGFEKGIIGVSEEDELYYW